MSNEDLAKRMFEAQERLREAIADGHPVAAREWADVIAVINSVIPDVDKQ